MIARVWLHDSAGAWLNTLRDEAGALIADVAHCPGLCAPLNAIVRIEGAVEYGDTLVTVTMRRYTLIEGDEGAEGVPKT
jgi:hypothetical protein